jgi:hypothetical protein
LRSIRDDSENSDAIVGEVSSCVDVTGAGKHVVSMRRVSIILNLDGASDEASILIGTMFVMVAISRKTAGGGGRRKEREMRGGGF